MAPLSPISAFPVSGTRNAVPSVWGRSTARRRPIGAQSETVSAAFFDSQPGKVLDPPPKAWRACRRVDLKLAFAIAPRIEFAGQIIERSPAARDLDNLAGRHFASGTRDETQPVVCQEHGAQRLHPLDPSSTTASAASIAAGASS